MRSVSAYEGALRLAIHALKYSARPRLARRLGELWLQIPEPPFARERYTALIPVPMHRARLRERGFNHAELLARALSARIGVPVAAGVVRRVRATQPLYPLGPEERREAVAGAFRARLPGELQGRPLLLVDDIITTGATISTLAQALQEEGAGPIDAVSLARARRPGEDDPTR
ncbi:MAG: hypothetical protein KatS3mg115_0365 [Candidatus Poribacteria bacterium]|nr:MAG: hypothetical protein KatS3mg115_0365 [Candidatus Poribacteria bacterium]